MHKKQELPFNFRCIDVKSWGKKLFPASFKNGRKKAAKTPETLWENVKNSPEISFHQFFISFFHNY